MLLLSMVGPYAVLYRDEGSRSGRWLGLATDVQRMSLGCCRFSQIVDGASCLRPTLTSAFRCGWRVRRICRSTERCSFPG